MEMMLLYCQSIAILCHQLVDFAGIVLQST